jgi:hypothetical protein
VRERIVGWIVARNLNFIFIHIPKTAGSSIGDPSHKKIYKGALIQYLGEGDEAHQGHIRASELHKQLHESWDDFFKFCFVRNPWDRFVSAYVYYAQASSSFLSRLRFTQEFFRSHSQLGRQIARCQNFKEFCLNLYEFDLDIHFEPQLNYIANNKGELLVDFIGRYETLEQDFSDICERIGLPHCRLPHFRRTKRQSYKYYYDQQTKEIIRNFYKDDIELLKYEF